MCIRDSASIRALVGYMPEHDCLPADMSAAEFTTFMGRCLLYTSRCV